jgi:hypothetical protein
MATMEGLTIDTPRGQARAHVSLPDRAATPGAAVALILGHGAGGGIAVALVEQPYRVLGRRAPAPAAHLDDAWRSVIDQLRDASLAGMAVVTGGRSMGARVACRTADATGSVGVLCLAFPLQPPHRRGAAAPAPSRLPELDAVTVPTLVIQGRSDRFGIPPEGPLRTVVQVAGDHGLKSDLAGVRAAAAEWLARLPSG